MYLKTEIESEDKTTEPQEINILERLKLKQLEKETDFNESIEKADVVEKEMLDL